MKDKKITTGLDKLDELFKGGLEKGELCIIPSGNPSYKSNFIRFLPIEKEKQYFIQLEMSHVINMEMCLRLKLEQHPNLIDELLATGDLPIIEDVTARGDKGGNLFWGAMLVNGEWVGQNVLGNLWMNLRTSYKENKNKNV